MANDKSEVFGKFRYDQDSKRYHRFRIETDAGIIGTVYVPKNRHSIPEKLTLVNARQAEED
jgi:hypothetical protein